MNMLNNKMEKLAKEMVMQLDNLDVEDTQTQLWLNKERK